MLLALSPPVANEEGEDRRPEEVDPNCGGPEKPFQPLHERREQDDQGKVPVRELGEKPVDRAVHPAYLSGYLAEADYKHNLPHGTDFIQEMLEQPLEPMACLPFK